MAINVMLDNNREKYLFFNCWLINDRYVPVTPFKFQHNMNICIHIYHYTIHIEYHMSIQVIYIAASLKLFNKLLTLIKFFDRHFVII